MSSDREGAQLTSLLAAVLRAASAFPIAQRADVWSGGRIQRCSIRIGDSRRRHGQ